MIDSLPSLRALAARLRTCTLELYAYVDQQLELVEAREGEIHALVPEPGRRDRLHHEVHDLLDRYPDLDERPPLFGVLMGVKDIYRVRGLPTRCGSELPEELFAGQEALVVTRLRQAGALILGKTVTTEFAYFEPGPTCNPRNRAHTPGGSSSGSAAAVAAGYCPLALGSQTVGSVARPAAYCGVAGFKTTRDAVSLDGVIPYSAHLDHFGFFTPSAADLDLVLEALLSDAAAPAGRRLARVEGAFLDQAGAEAIAVFRKQMQRLGDHGLEPVPFELPADPAEIADLVQTLCAAGMWRTHRDWYAHHAERYRPLTRAQIEAGREISEAQVERALNRRAILLAEIETWAAENQVDAWLSPPALGPAPRGLSSTGSPAMNGFWTLLGLPVAVCTSPDRIGGLPLGVQIAGRTGEDRKTAATAALVEEWIAGEGESAA